MAEHVRDPRQRFSYELRPDRATDAAIRLLASELERDGLLPAGAATAPRFHPHLTLLRADRADERAVDQLAASVPATLALRTAGTFGGGRIVYVAPAGARELLAVREQLIDTLGVASVDPLALARDPWVPHVTVAYAIDEPHRAEVLACTQALLPLTGRWRAAQSWDLGVRPTRLEHEVTIA